MLRPSTRTASIAIASALLATPSLLRANEPATASAAASAGTPASLYFADVDRDGLDDALVINDQGQVALLSNLGEGRFEDITLASGLAGLDGASCALFADFDGDGYLDLFVGSSEKRLWRNLGNASFEAVDSGIEHDLIDLTAAAADHDNDGRLDLQIHTEAGDVVYRNVGKLAFERVELAGSDHAAPTVIVGVEEASNTEGGVAPDESPARRRIGRWLRARRAESAASTTNSAPGSLDSSAAGGASGGSSNLIFCNPSIRDAATGNCLGASSTPALGTLYPLTTSLNVNGSGNVGMGTSAPLGNLDLVHSNARLRVGASGNNETAAITLSENNSDTAGFDVRYEGAGNLFQIAARDGTSTPSPKLSITRTTGNVGIGTTSPTQKLDVAGNAAVSGNLGVGTTNPTYKVHVAGVNGGEFRVFDFPGGLGTQEVVGLLGAPNLGPQIRFYGPGAGFIDIGEDPSGAFVVEGSDVPRLTVTDAGNVGIGNENPSAKLEVVGSMKIDSNTLVVDDVSHRVGIGAANPSANLEVAGSVRVDGSTLVVDDVNNRVGIGTTSPGQALQVSGNARLINLFADFGSSTTPTIRFVDTSETAGFSSPSVNSVAVITSGAERMRFSSGGNVGIGTSGPTAKLHVVGQVAGGDIAAFNNHMMSSRVASTNGTIDTAIFGSNEGTSGIENGVYGRTQSSSGYGVFSEGSLGATGTKSFIQPHPTDASKEIRFVCLEGNESGTYFRGSAKLVGGRCVIDVPEDFRLVSEAAGLTVQVTAIGLPAALWIESRDLQHVVVRGNVDVDFDYFVNGVRRGYSHVETIGENFAYRPQVRGVPYGTQYPQEIRELLVQSGILNADYTPNEQTAARLGWTLVDEAPVPVTPESTDETGRR